MLALDFISPNAAAAADLTSGLLSVNAFSASLALLASFGIRPRTRIAVARSLVLSLLHALSSNCQACSRRVWEALDRTGRGCPGLSAGGCVAGSCAPGVAFGLACCCAGKFSCDGRAADCRNVNNWQHTRNTNARLLGQIRLMCMGWTYSTN